MTQPAGGDAQSFPCSNCGAKLNYDAGTQAMKCPYCGHQQAVQTRPAVVQQAGYVQQEQVREIPIEQGMAMAAKGLGVQVTTINCKDCGATVNIGEGERTTACAFCGSHQVLQAHTNDQAIRPESLVPFKINKQSANELFGKWLASLWFRPNDLTKIAKVQEMGGVYVPFWTFDSMVYSNWTAERGWYYYETETYTAYENGQSVTRTRQVQRTRWESAWGSRNDFFDDTLVCAGKGLPGDLVEKFSTFNTRELIPYAPHYLAGWRAEAYAIDLMPAWSIGQQKMARVQEGRCAGDIGGDTHRGLNVSNNFTQVTFKHVLLPIWIAAYRYNDKVYRFLVNGQTGEVVGKAPYSFWKIFFLVLGILTVIGIGVGIYYATHEEEPEPPQKPVPTATAKPTAKPTAKDDDDDDVPVPSATATGSAKKPAALPSGTKPATAPSGSAKPAASGSAKPAASGSAKPPAPAPSGAKPAPSAPAKPK
jgi:DNA-directed RNA polymerase subunit RPC12/RpoP